jgi:hypothetical protein
MPKLTLNLSNSSKTDLKTDIVYIEVKNLRIELEKNDKLSEESKFEIDVKLAGFSIKDP